MELNKRIWRIGPQVYDLENRDLSVLNECMTWGVVYLPLDTGICRDSSRT